jgi:hypothetical protein
VGRFDEPVTPFVHSNTVGNISIYETFTGPKTAGLLTASETVSHVAEACTGRCLLFRFEQVFEVLQTPHRRDARDLVYGVGITT